jgi:hypothetical protein
VHFPLTEVQRFLGPFAYGLLWVVCKTSDVWKVQSPEFVSIYNALSSTYLDKIKEKLVDAITLSISCSYAALPKIVWIANPEQHFTMSPVLNS